MTANTSWEGGHEANDTAGCELPLLDPWHPDILDFVSYMPSTECASHQKSLLSTSQDRLNLNLTALAEINLTRSELLCAFSYVTTDQVLLPAEQLEGDESVLSPDHNSVAVKCAVNGTTVYQNVLLYLPSPKPSRDARKKYSVTLFIIESMSQMNLVRSLPRTLATVEELGGILFKGHHKVGENTCPNMEVIHKGDMFNAYHDNGWFTFFFEDAQIWGTSLKYRAKLDLKYHHHYKALHQAGERLRSNNLARWLQLNEEFTKTETYRCQQEQLVFKYQFSLIQDFHETYRDRRTFTQIHLLEGTHDDLNFAKYYDRDMNKMVRDLADSGALNDTFFLIMGDHGFGGWMFRARRQGHIESTMPGLLLLPPPSLATDHPEMVAALRENSELLTTHHDLNMMLGHILALSTDQKEEKLFPRHHAARRGTSLLRPVGKRTCSEAGVPLEYCSCQEGRVALMPEAVAGLARAALRDMDTFLEGLWGCLPLQLDRVVEAHTRTEDGATMLETKVIVVPSSAIFLIRMFPNRTEDTVNVTASFTRLDKYKPTSLCVPPQDARAKPFCICP